MMMLLFRKHVGKSSVKENVDEWDNILPMTSIADSEIAGRLTGDSC
ncbi:Uncharacterized protein APZ42_030768 [Daphnia magna]|uniref:Uncharacterized protein n=1 Tax=Daphnia magna TaxID=35525 RepID=A0A164NAT1_9CRUS|nr:Uncharacterized protein APZ42_030768 [Daphnia magna]